MYDGSGGGGGAGSAGTTSAVAEKGTMIWLLYDTRKRLAVVGNLFPRMNTAICCIVCVCAG